MASPAWRSPIRCPSSVKLAWQLGNSWAMRRAAAIQLGCYWVVAYFLGREPFGLQ
jgi:hypothetical protein